MKFVYPAVFHETKEHSYTGYFPDLECCSVVGDTLDEALENAGEAAYNWIIVELEEDGDLPPISDLEDLTLQEGDIVRNISVTIRLTDGWDE